MNQLTISGETVLITNEGNFRIKIKEPFHKAGKIYKFANQDEGIGISTGLFNLAKREGKKIEVRLEDKLYEVSTEKIKDIFSKHNSVYETEGGTILYVIPLYVLNLK
jgi:hypothetical protein